MRGAFLQMVEEGFSSVYRGVLPPLLQKSVSSSLMFGTYDMFRKPLIESTLQPRLSNLIAALLAGSVEAVLTPFERIQTLLQDSAYQKKFTNMKHAVNEIGAHHGFKEYYRGFTPILLRNGPSTGLFFVLKEELVDRDHRTDTFASLTALKEFLTGACIGALNSTIFYPFNVIKVHMQSQLGGSFVSVWKAAREIYVERGRKISKFYSGVHMNYTRSFISWGVINLAYERFKFILKTDGRTASN